VIKEGGVHKVHKKRVSIFENGYKSLLYRNIDYMSHNISFATLNIQGKHDSLYVVSIIGEVTLSLNFVQMSYLYLKFLVF